MLWKRLWKGEEGGELELKIFDELQIELLSYDFDPIFWTSALVWDVLFLLNFSFDVLAIKAFSGAHILQISLKVTKKIFLDVLV